MKSTIEYCNDLLKHKKIKPISSTLYQVEDYQVKFQVKKGRTLLICTCTNDTLFCNESPICVHKLAVINYLFNKDFYIQMDKLISLYESWVKLKLPIRPEVMLSDLQNLRRIK